MSIVWNDVLLLFKLRKYTISNACAQQAWQSYNICSFNKHTGHMYSFTNCAVLF